MPFLMTWMEFKRLVKSKLEFSESSFVSLNTLVYGSPTDKQMFRHFQDFIMRSREVYVPNAVITLSAGDQYIDLLDPDVSDPPLWYVDALWSGSTILAPLDPAEFSRLYSPSSASFSVQGTPRVWSQVDGDGGQIVLNVPLNAAAATTGVRASGFGLHPALTVGDEDNTQLRISHLAHDPAAEYVAVQLARPVINEQAEAGRIGSYAKSAEAWIRSRSAKQKLRLVNKRGQFDRTFTNSRTDYRGVY